MPLAKDVEYTVGATDCRDIRRSIFADPYRLLSLWDLMKAIQPERLFHAVRGIWIDSGILPPIGNPNRATRIQLTVEHLRECQAICDELGLQVSALKTAKCLEMFALSTDHVDMQAMDRSVQIISATVEEELSLRKYFEIQPDKSKYFSESQHPFGEDVADKFFSTTFDAAEASRCYALSRNTACVFHLMRVMEIGLAALAKPFDVTYEHRNQEQIIKDIENAIAMIEKDLHKPVNWRDAREFYSQCSSHFRVMKDAYRNCAAHPRGKFDEPETFDIFVNVRGFMQKLAMRLSEAAQ